MANAVQTVNNNQQKEPEKIETMTYLKRALMKDGAFRRKFESVLGARTEKFVSQVIANVGRNSYLAKASPVSIMGAAMSAATLNLDLSPSLGLATIVPYSDSKSKQTLAQFQIMVNGWVQLALRSGEYANINAGFVYSDEFMGRDILTGEVKLQWVTDGLRSKDNGGLTLSDMRKAGIVGCFCYFELTNGFKKTVYWSLEEIDRHGRLYSQTYKNDISKGWNSSPWSNNFRAMAQKTVIKNAIVKWGPKSTEMYNALFKENQVTDDNGNQSDADTDFIDVPESVQDAEVKDVEEPEDYAAAPMPEDFDDDLTAGL